MSDTSPFGFGRFVPGFDFLQNLAKNASESGSSKMPGLSGWIAPTMSVEDVEKRVDELKAVQFWLEQNSRALTATIQALEVQKMTLSTLKGMNVTMGDMGALFQPKQASEKSGAAAAMPGGDAMTSVAQAMTDAMARATSAFTAPMAQAAKGSDKAAAPAPAPAPAPAAAAPAPEAAQGQSSGVVVDPMQWWGALTQQFQQIANNALQDVAQQASLEKAAGMTQDAFKTATEMASKIAATGLKSVPGAAGGTGKSKSETEKKKPASASASAGKAAGTQAKDTAGDTTPAAKKTPARRAAAPSKRARG